jgi:Uma2 family endonuclease
LGGLRLNENRIRIRFAFFNDLDIIIIKVRNWFYEGAEVSGLSIPELNKKYTFADYLKWDTQERYELIDGIPVMMTPAPSWQHQAISRQLTYQFAAFLQGKKCQVFNAPFDVRIPCNEEKDQDITNVFQPDLLVICDPSRLSGSGYYGVPTLIIEILSPYTVKTDRILKFNKYEQAGVQEYWIVEPEVKIVTRFKLQENQKYGRPENYTEEEKIDVSVLPGLTVDLSAVFNF